MSVFFIAAVLKAIQIHSARYGFCFSLEEIAMESGRLTSSAYMLQYLYEGGVLKIRSWKA